MSGPFSHEETELILHGPFQSSPLIMAVQPQYPGVPDKLRVCWHLSKSTRAHPSVNSYIHKADFPTRFDLASKVAHMVSYSWLRFPHHFLSLFMHPFAFCAWGCLLLSATCSFWYLHHGCITWTLCPHRSTSGTSGQCAEHWSSSGKHIECLSQVR